MDLDNITQVIQKAVNIVDKLEEKVTLSDRLFDPMVWNPVLKQLESSQSSEITIKYVHC